MSFPVRCPVFELYNLIQHWSIVAALNTSYVMRDILYSCCVCRELISSPSLSLFLYPFIVFYMPVFFPLGALSPRNSIAINTVFISA